MIHRHFHFDGYKEWDDMLKKELDPSKFKMTGGPGAKFKRIVVKAFIKEGVKDIDDIHECLKFAVGEQYPYLPYQHWGEEIWKRHQAHLTQMKFQDYKLVPVHIVMRAVARLWRQKHKIYAVGGIG